MQTIPDCTICLLKQYLRISRLCGIEEEMLSDNFYLMLSRLSDTLRDMSPPEAAAYFTKQIADVSGITDPYYEIKRASNKAAMKHYPMLKNRVSSSSNTFAEALSLAIAGNLIDFGAKENLDLSEALDEILNQPLFLQLENGEIANSELFMFNEFYNELASAENILYLGDNAGEIVFDRIFIETILSEFPDKKISFVVRGGPALNDVLIEDAIETGLSEIVNVISSGAQTAGTVMNQCSEDFIKKLMNADMVISKGQGNYESLCDEDISSIWFLFRIKCPMVSRHAGGPEGTLVLKKIKQLVSADAI
ncbi:MAG: ARMT1-like domain-containing protein [Spirochaetales bacterium]|nr:ARMT1-like domain-containing protein [Spirochaetales bacterium]